ncbi:hypothetical protein [Actinoplanes sp. NPDC026623]|uniref:hypothetical protein n=1 Tax=Actinoplanes sp. NPDC026623 TaxID=3155610 RepID=UPI0033E732CB
MAENEHSEEPSRRSPCPAADPDGRSEGGTSSGSRADRLSDHLDRTRTATPERSRQDGGDRAGYHRESGFEEQVLRELRGSPELHAERVESIRRQALRNAESTRAAIGRLRRRRFAFP